MFHVIYSPLHHFILPSLRPDIVLQVPPLETVVTDAIGNWSYTYSGNQVSTLYTIQVYTGQYPVYHTGVYRSVP